MKGENYLKEVRNQYENYPYPQRFPEEEKKRILRPFFDSLDLMNHFCFNGKKVFDKNFRALVVGGGTGDATTYLAEQLREFGGEVVQVDMSSASIEVAKKRALTRKLDNVSFIHQSLLDIPKLDIGKFDYINCSGVLHHLANPKDGLNAIKSALKPDGAMGIMVYGQYGRTSTYFMQYLMKIVNKNETDLQQKVDNCKTVINYLPETNLVKRDWSTYVDEIEQSGDIGIFDLFLHPQDRAYTVPDVYEWVDSCDLKLLTFLDQHGMEKLIYSPAYYIKDAALLERINKLSKRDQEAIGELMMGALRKHNFYLAFDERLPASFDDEDNVPIFSSIFYEDGIYESARNAVKNNPGNILNINKEMVSISIIKKKYTAEIFEFIDGKNSIKEIVRLVKNKTLGSAEEIKSELKEIYFSFNQFDWMVLKHKASNVKTKSQKDLQKVFEKDNA